MTVQAKDVQVGDRLLGPSGDEITVTRIDKGLLGRADLIAFVEDSAVRWVKVPSTLEAEVQVTRDLPG